jgi:hypothetical protein
MKNTIFIILPLLFLFQLKLNAQEVVASGGDYFSNAYGSLSFTFGETVTETFSRNDHILTQGFQQSRLVVTVADSLTGTDIIVNANPNPARSVVKISVENAEKEKLTYKLLKTSGEQLLSGQFDPPETDIPVYTLPPSIYILKIYQNTQEIKSFKIIKQ